MIPEENSSVSQSKCREELKKLAIKPLAKKYPKSPPKTPKEKKEEKQK